jgi:putative spermidine/putrescine transport system substrate-binding protein
MGQGGRNRGLNRRDVLRGAGALGLAGALPGAPAIAQPRTLTVSVWGGLSQDFIKAQVQPEFEKRTGATLAYDIGGQGARYNKLLAQKNSPATDVFFAGDEAIVAGHRAGVLTPAHRKSLTNLGEVADWAMRIKETVPEDMVMAVPFTLIAYMLAYNPEVVKEKPTSWADMWRPEFRDKLAFASPIHSLMPAFVVLAAELAGGSETNVDPGFKKLAELRPAKLTIFWTDWAALDKTGDVTLATEFDYYLETMKDQKYPIEYVIPKEKGIATPESVAIVQGTKNQEIAEAFLDLMISAKVQEAFATQLYSGSINKTVQLSPAAQARCACGARIDQLRFFDPAMFADNRPAWTERLNTDVVPNWRAR